MGRKSATRTARRRLRAATILLLGVSAAQYISTGAVSWPQDLYRKVTGALGEYTARPAAGWRRAADTLEQLGAAKEGQPLPEFDVVGRVVRVADGDTLSILDRGNRQHKVRLYGIDTPEQDQPHGRAAQKALAGLVAARMVGVVVVETDSYGRKVGTVYRDGSNINSAMVAAGDAWWYRHYAPHSRELAAGEEAAREQGLGLWSSRNPIPPWEWRRGRR